jgi:hypothetical protein
VTGSNPELDIETSPCLSPLLTKYNVNPSVYLKSFLYSADQQMPVTKISNKKELKGFWFPKKME